MIKKAVFGFILAGSLTIISDTSLENSFFDERIQESRKEEIYKNREELLNSLKDDIAEELRKYPFNIGLFSGGTWTISYKNSVIGWDEKSDLDKISFDGVDIGMKSRKSTITHEYFHAIWDIYGEFASKETRKINRNQFRIDTEVFMNDIIYQNTKTYKRLRKYWGVDYASKERMNRLRNKFPEEYGLEDIIPAALTERFASISEIHYENHFKLPDYIGKHFEIFFK